MNVLSRGLSLLRDLDAALHDSAAADPERVRAILAAGAKVNSIQDHGWTPLLRAAAAGNAAVVQVLLTAGADVRARVATGATALLLAVDSGDVPTVAALLAVSDIEQRDPQGLTPLMCAAGSGKASVVK